MKMLPYLVTAILTTWSLYSLFERFNENQNIITTVATFIGNNTLTILTWHSLMFKITFLLIIYIYDLPIERLAEFPVITGYSHQGWWLCYFLTAMLTTCGIAYCNKYINSGWLINKLLISMSFHYHNIPTDNGDCHFITLQDGSDKFVIMVDCGKFCNTVQNYVESDCGKHIDILVVTHIDDDHIKGIIEMLEHYRDDDDFQIGDIWFNSYQSTGDEVTRKLTTEETDVILRLKNDLRNKLKPYSGVISTEQSMTLAEIILDTPKYERAWTLRTITTDTPVQRLGRWGKICFISPSPDRLHDLMRDYARWFYEHLYKKLQKGEKYEGSESIFEILVQFSEANKRKATEGEAASEVSVTESLLKAKAKPSRLDESPTNGSSIAFVWKRGRHRILMLGDAWADEVTKGLLKAYPRGCYPLLFDFVKISHHASAANTTSTLLDHIDSKEWFITGYTNNKSERLKTVSRVILQPFKCKKIQVRNLHFNCETWDYETLAGADESLKKALHFTVDNQTDYDIR